jgi:hypothetical protein
MGFLKVEFFLAGCPLVNKHRSGTPGLREDQPVDLVRELGGQPGSQSDPTPNEFPRATSKHCGFGAYSHYS